MDKPSDIMEKPLIDPLSWHFMQDARQKMDAPFVFTRKE